MAKRERPAVRGLDALLGSATLEGLTAPESAVRVVRLDQIGAGDNPRRSFDEAGLRELAQSIRDKGMLQPLLLRPRTDGGEGYQLVAGERRLRAARLANLEEVPAVVRSLTDREAREAALIENLRREDLNPVDRADATARLIAEELDLAPQDVPATLRALRRRPRDEGAPEVIARLEGVFALLGGSWQTFTVHALPILNYPPDVLGALRGGALEYTKGAVIAKIGDAGRRAELLARASEGASLEELRREAAPPPPAAHEDRTAWQRVKNKLGNWRSVEALPSAKQKQLRELLSRIERLLDEE